MDQKRCIGAIIWFSFLSWKGYTIFSLKLNGSQKGISVADRLLAFLMIGSVIWIPKTLLVNRMDSNFHRRWFFDRIKESIFLQNMILTLSSHPIPTEFAKNSNATKSSGQLVFRTKGKEKGKGREKIEMINVSSLHKTNQVNISDWNIKWLANMIRTSCLSTYSNGITKSIVEGEKTERDINNEEDAKLAAVSIFKNVAKPGCKYIDADDLSRFLATEDVEYVMPLFEGAANKVKIEKSALKSLVIIVEETNILYTAFLNLDKAKGYYQNYLLATKLICNRSRSRDMSEVVEFSITVSTSAVESIEALIAKIKLYIDGKSKHWHAKHILEVKDIVDGNKWNMALYIEHTINYRNVEVMSKRRSDLLLALHAILQELNLI